MRMRRTEGRVSAVPTGPCAAQTKLIVGWLRVRGAPRSRPDWPRHGRCVWLGAERRAECGREAQLSGA